MADGTIRLAGCSVWFTLVMVKCSTQEATTTRKAITDDATSNYLPI